jgi:hypothetical protein
MKNIEQSNIFKHNVAGGNTQHDKKHECVMGLHIQYQKRKTQA